jgi:hypothetical protein
MSKAKEPSSAYLFAENLYYGFRGETDLLTNDELASTPITHEAGHMTGVDGIETRGVKDGTPIRQRLSLGKQGMYYLTTTYDYNPDQENVHRAHISPVSEKRFVELQNSLFAVILDDILQKRPSQDN